MKFFPVGLFSCAVTLLFASGLSAASISLDTVGADPDLTSPTFSFQTDQLGSYMATYRNVSNPPYDFVRLELIAPFSQAFYNGSSGPHAVGASCSGGGAFSNCSITFLDGDFTLVFDFFGVDRTHPGIPYNREFGVVATLFEPNQTVGGTATPSSTPEPGALVLTVAGLCWGGIAMRRKKLLKLGVAA